MTDLFQTLTSDFGSNDAETRMIKVTTSSSGYSPSDSPRTVLLNQTRHDCFIETMEVRGDEIQRWRTQVDPKEAQWYLDRLRDIKVPAWPASPTVTDGEFIEITVYGKNAQLTLGWWSAPPCGAEYLGELADWMRRRGAHEDDDDEKAEVAEERLISMVDYFKSSILRLDRHEIREGVIKSVLSDLHKQPSPDEDEDLKSAFDFVGLLMTEGANHILYEMTMGILRSDLFDKVSALDDDSQIALLLPMSNDTDDMVRDQDIEDWPKYLRSQDEWRDKMLSSLLGRIPEIYRS